MYSRISSQAHFFISESQTHSLHTQYLILFVVIRAVLIGFVSPYIVLMLDYHVSYMDMANLLANWVGLLYKISSMRLVFCRRAQ